MHLDAFQSLADPTRRRIVETLRSGELQVGEIVQQAGIHQSGVSRHLRILHESGFVSVRPDGQRRLYSLKPEPFRELDEWLSQYRGLWEARLDRLETAALVISSVASLTAAAVLAVTMLVAIITVHLANGFFMSNNGYEFALALLAISVALVFEGAGKLSVDGKLAR